MVIIEYFKKIIFFGSTASLSLSLFAANDQTISWIDLPVHKIETYLNVNTCSLRDVSNLIEDYNKIKKDDYNNIPLRIKSLQKIHLELIKLKSIVKDKKTSSALEALAHTAVKKAEYLQELKLIYQQKFYTPDYLYNYHFDNKIIDETYKPLYLVNRLLYDAKVPTFWGYYWLETLDPCHRQLTDYYLKWSELKTTTPFFMWLETQDMPYYIPAIYYFTDAELNEKQVNITKGILCDRKNKPLNIDQNNTPYLFVVTMDKKIYIAEGSLKIRHTSITRGKPVLASGEIKVKNGVVFFWNTESGHYQPNVQQAVQTAKIFSELKIVQHEDCMVMYYNTSGKNFISCQKILSLGQENTENTNFNEYTQLHNLL